MAAPDLVEFVARSLVDSPDEVKVEVSRDDRGTVIELHVAPDDMGKVIGKQGRTVRALRLLAHAVSIKKKHRFVLEIAE